MPHPLVSVLIPCRNEELYLQQTLDSVYALDYPSVEILALDDGSQDGTRTILESNSNRIRVLDSRKNLGPGGARNRLLEAAKGKFVHFQDADDLIHPRFLTHMLPWLQLEAYKVVLCQVDNFYGDDPTDIRDGFSVRPRKTGEHSVEHVVDVAGHAINSLYTRDVLLEVGGFRTDIRAAEDMDLHLRLAELGHCFAVVGQSLVLHRIRREPRTFTNQELIGNAFRVLRDSLRRNSEQQFMKNEHFQRRMAERFWHMARLLTDNGDEAAAIEAYNESRAMMRCGCLFCSPLYAFVYYALGFRWAERLRSRKARIGAALAQRIS